MPATEFTDIAILGRYYWSSCRMYTRDYQLKNQQIDKPPLGIVDK